MITLAIVGPPVEAELGKVRFLVVYLLSAVGGSVASYLLSRANVLGLGASGAIFGLMGAYFVLARRRQAGRSRTIVGLDRDQSRHRVCARPLSIGAPIWAAMITGAVVTAGPGAVGRQPAPRQPGGVPSW